MKKRIVIVLVLLSFAIGKPLRAQDLKMSVGVGTAIPEVLAADFALRFHPAFTARLSVGGIGLPFKGTYKIDAPPFYQDHLGYDPELKMTHHYKVFMLGLLVDYAPIAQFRAFHITGGLFVGRPKLVEDAILINPTTQRPIVDDLREKGYMGEKLEPFVFEEQYKLQPREDGSVTAEALLGGILRPYLGIGIGQSVPTKRVGVRFDVGVLLGSKPKLSSPQLIEGDLTELGSYWSGYKTVENLVRVMPRVQLSVMYRIN